MRAAEKLQSVLDGRDRGTDVLELKVQLDLIGKAVRAVVPQQMWAKIIAKLEELEQEQHAESLDVGTDSFDDADADDPYDPTEFIDEDDEFRPPQRPPSPKDISAAPCVHGAVARRRPGQPFRTGTPNSRLVAGSYGKLKCSTAFAGGPRQLHVFPVQRVLHQRAGTTGRALNSIRTITPHGTAFSAADGRIGWLVPPSRRSYALERGRVCVLAAA